MMSSVMLWGSSLGMPKDGLTHLKSGCCVCVRGRVGFGVSSGRHGLAGVGRVSCFLIFIFWFGGFLFVLLALFRSFGMAWILQGGRMNLLSVGRMSLRRMWTALILNFLYNCLTYGATLQRRKVRTGGRCEARLGLMGAYLLGRASSLSVLGIWSAVV